MSSSPYLERESGLGSRGYESYGREGDSPNGREHLAKGLGWFSIGLGIAQVTAPNHLSRLIGIQDRPLLMRLLGLREIATGIGILAQDRPAGWLWGRVAGDAMDLALLGIAFGAEQSDRTRLGAATAAVAGVTALDVICGRQLSGDHEPIEVRQAQTINRPPEEVYRFWREFQNLPRFMKHLESVRTLGGNRSHWTAKGPAGSRIEWDAEMTEDRPNQAIAWRSLENADVENSGTVRFKPVRDGSATELHVEISYMPPGGKLGSYVAMLFGEEPSQQVREDLRRLKQLIETGEIATTAGQPTGPSRTAILGRLLHRADQEGERVR